MNTTHTRRGKTQQAVSQNNCHAEEFLLSISSALITQGRAPEQKRLRMTLFNMGAFTLIELLVVVIIIGILAAVALPQYQFAVDKARILPYITTLPQIAKAQRLYYLEHGKYTSNFENLKDMDFTKLCQSISGGVGHNELFKCQGGAGFDIASASRIRLRYCGGLSAPCSSSTTTTQQYVLIAFSISANKITTCTSPKNSTGGEKLCKWVKPE